MTWLQRFRGDRGASKVYPALVIAWLLATVVFVSWVGFTYDWWVQGGPLNTFEPKGTNAHNIHDNLVVWVFGAAGVVFFLVMGVILGVSLRRRVSEDEWADEDGFPEQMHGNNKLEIFWTVVPAMLMVGMVALMLPVQADLNDFNEEEALTIEVWGNQWWWEYRYDTDNDGAFDNIITANELVIPAGVDVELLVSSNDVIHSYWIPELNGKKDAVPGFQSRLKIQADLPGRYRGTCTEFCGLSHARMQMYTIALPPEEYAAWVDHQLQPAQEREADEFESAEAFAQYESGRATFESQCASCHNIAGVAGPDPAKPHPLLAGSAPDLTHLMSRETFAGATRPLWQETDGTPVQDTLEGETTIASYLTKDGLVPETEFLERWIQNPQEVKPSAPEEGRGMPNLNLSPQQVDDLVAYLTTLE